MSIVLGSIVLPDHLFWRDQYDWAPVVQRLSRFENGVFLREESPLIAGRPITLVASENYGWSTNSTRAVVDQLYATQQEANNAPMTLSIHGTEYAVAWRFEGGSQPMIVRPLFGPVSNPDPDEPYVLAELRFITV